MKVEVVPTTPPRIDLVYSTFGPVLSLLATAFIVTVLCIFMLVDREDLRDRVIRLVSHGQLNVTTQAMDDAATRVSRYLLMQAITNGTYALLVATGLYFIGVPNPLLWGLLAGLLRFLPYVGPWLGASIPVLLVVRDAGRDPRADDGRDVRDAGDRRQQLRRAVALRQPHGRLVDRDPRGGDLLGVDLGRRGTAAGDAVDGAARRRRKVRAAVGVPERAARR